METKKLAKQGMAGEVVKLGDGDVFITRDERGEVQSVVADVELSIKDGDFYSIPAGKVDKLVPSIQGYSKLNRIPGISIIHPRTVSVHGREESNPYVQLSKSKTIETVHCRVMAVGLTPTGQWQIIDKTLFFNVYTYFLQAAQKLVLHTPGAGCLGTKRNKPTCYPENTELVFYPIEPPVGVWLVLSNKEAQGLFKEHVQRQKFGDRQASSIAARNALKEHAAIATSQLPTPVNGKVKVRVFGFRHSAGPKQLISLVESAAHGLEAHVEVKTSTEEISAPVAEAEALVDEAKGQETEVEPGDRGAPEQEAGDRRHPEDVPERSLPTEVQLSEITQDIYAEIYRVGQKAYMKLLREDFKTDNHVGWELDSLRDLVGRLKKLKGGG